MGVISGPAPPGRAGRILLERYQSPLLLQRTGTPPGVRRFSVIVHRFK